MHTDSLGNEQLIQPGQLNLMTAGNGIVHAEQADRVRSQTLHGIQLWLAQPDETRTGRPAFTHHGVLPEIESGSGRATAFLGTWGAAESDVSIEHPAVGVDITHAPGTSTWALDPRFEYAVYCAVGNVDINGSEIGEGQLLNWSGGLEELHLRTHADTRLILLGGEPWEEPLFMWWNFVARSKAEVAEAITAWSDWTDQGDNERFAPLRSSLAAIPAPPLV